MAHIIEGRTCPEVWFKACNHLLSQGAPKYDDYNLILNITKPFEITVTDKIILKLANDFLVSKGGKALDTVVDTIFPTAFYKKGFDHMVENYPKFIDSVPKKSLGGWRSTYAYRMLSTKELDGKSFCPLGNIIKNIKKFPRQGKRHEMNLTSFDGDIRIFDPNSGDDKYMGGPCLSHISIKVFKSEYIHLTALYRNHYYIQRLLGNLIGLSRVQSCIARETGLKPGSLVSHSTAAELDIKPGCWGIRDIKTLLKSAEGIYQSKI